MSPKLDAAPQSPASEPVAKPVEMPVVTRPGYEPLRKTQAQKEAEEKKRAELEAKHPMLTREVVPEEKAFGDMTTEEIIAKYPKEPPKPLEQYTINELIALKGLGPAMIGGILYVKSQAAVAETGLGTLGPAILSKGFEPVPFVSHLNGDQ